MLQSGLLTKNFIGKDGFIWWIGQVPDAKTWQGNIPELPKATENDLPGFKHRVKVRIIGYHTADVTQLKDDDLPWALVMLPVTAGSGSGGNSQTPRFAGGEFVLGFFLDGENSQQPVIFGILGNSTQTLLSKTIPPGGAGYIPISGYPSNGKKVPPHAIKTSGQIESQMTANNATPAVPTGSAGGTAQTKISSNKPNPTQSPNSEGSQSTGDIKTQHQEAQQQDNKEYSLGNACKSNKKELNGIQKAIKNFIKFVNSIQKYYDKFISPVTNKLQDIQKEIQKVTGIISGFLKSIIGKLRGFVLDKINDGIKNLMSALPVKKQIEAGEAQQKACNGISCIFNKIVDSLFGLISQFLSTAASNFISAPICIAENLVSSLLDNVLGQIESGIQKALDPVNKIVQGIGAASGQVIGALGFTSSLSSFFSCEQEDNCPEQESWSWLDGPKSETESNFQNIANKIGSFPSNITQQGVSGITSSLNSIVGDGFFAAGGESANTSSCNTGLVGCGPPKVDIFGGGGAGALANAIVGSNGEILAVDIINRGVGYLSNPFVFFNDECGNGSGARARVNTDNGQVVAIDIIDGGNGYLPTPNGSLGGNGNTYVGVGSTSNALIFPNGLSGIGSTTFGSIGINTSITNPTGVGSTTPAGISSTNVGAGSTINLNGPISVKCGSLVNLPPGACVVVSTAASTIAGLPTDFTKSGSTYCFPTGAQITIPCPPGPPIKTNIYYRLNSSQNVSFVVTENSSYFNYMNIWGIKNFPENNTPNPETIFVNAGTYPVTATNNTTQYSAVRIDPKNPQRVQANDGGGSWDDIEVLASAGEFITTIPANVPITPQGGTGIGSTAPSIGIGSTARNNSGITTGPYRAILDIDDLLIPDSGIYYDPNDKIKISPDNGANLKPLFDPFGRLVSIKILNKGRPVTSRPKITIESKTGINAEIFPILRVRRYGDVDLATQKIKPNELVIVIDCVGKPNG